MVFVAELDQGDRHALNEAFAVEAEHGRGVAR